MMNKSDLRKTLGLMRHKKCKEDEKSAKVKKYLGNNINNNTLLHAHTIP